MDRDQVITLLQQHLPSLAAQYGVKRIGLFGSFARGLPDSSSDIDLVVEFERPIGFKFVELAEYLELLLGRRVDLLTPEGVRGIRIFWIARDIEHSIIYV
ncbi:MAG TPA: nucleotidyltransferase [Chloroflexi bacterium]|nr:nucleotidyltransferase [Chloroflexota bacterium]